MGFKIREGEAYPVTNDFSARLRSSVDEEAESISAAYSQPHHTVIYQKNTFEHLLTLQSRWPC